MNSAIWSSRTFSIHSPNAVWESIAGIYIFAGPCISTGTTPKNPWQALYVGQAAKFSERIPGHEQWEKARSIGATHVHALAVPVQARRDELEKELISIYQPPLNVQLK